MKLIVKVAITTQTVWVSDNSVLGVMNWILYCLKVSGLLVTWSWGYFWTIQRNLLAMSSKENTQTSLYQLKLYQIWSFGLTVQPIWTRIFLWMGFHMFTCTYTKMISFTFPWKTVALGSSWVRNNNYPTFILWNWFLEMKILPQLHSQNCGVAD